MPPPLATQEVAEEMGFKPQEWIGALPITKHLDSSFWRYHLIESRLDAKWALSHKIFVK